MYGKWITLCILLVFILTGCSTTKKSKTVTEMDELKTKVTELETQVQEKDAQIKDLEDELQSAQKDQSRVTYSSVSILSPKQVQRALQNAGYYSGSIDGIIGKGTKRAIKDFQRENGLTVDGVVGKETSLKLRKYLE